MPEPQRLPPAEGEPPNCPVREDPATLGFTRRPKVRWLAPAMLARTGAQVAVSQVFGAFLDRRELQALETADPLDLTGEVEDGEFWLDYVADLGDGFDATTTVASQLAEESLELPDADGTTHPTRAGRLLVMGGDQCYPVASRANYADRLVGPYRMMLPWTDRPRTLLALPGNHDWYDGLTSFLRQFCQGRWIGGWRTVQRRSYFAVKLPGGWWLWGIDIQLGVDIDQEQLDYFRQVAERLAPDDAIVLCWAMPAWVESGKDNPEGYAPLEYFERTVIPDRRMLRLSLSGDLHHYARYRGQDEAGQQKITAGGGGAYLFGTHKLPERIQLPPVESHDVGKQPPVSYQLERCYPDKATSKRLRWGILGSIYRNKGFWLVPAIVYLLLGVTLRRAFPALAGSDWWLASVPDLVLLMVLVFLLWTGLGLFTGLRRRRNPRLRAAVSGLHTAAHLALVTLTVVGVEVWSEALGWSPETGVAAVPLAAWLVGGLVGPAMVGVYLLLADHAGPHGVNTEELFAGQAIQDYKCFVRLRIAADGTLTVFPVRIDRAVRWTFAGGGRRTANGKEASRWYLPVDGVEPEPALIEPPITVPKRP